MGTSERDPNASTTVREPADASGKRAKSTSRGLGAAPSRIRLGPLARPVEPDARYEEEAVLGQGGMGVVRACRDQRLGRCIALKQLRADLLGDDALRTRFVREAEVQGQLEHPAVVPLYDFGESEGTPYFTMKRVRGATLHQLIRALAKGDPEIRQRFGRHKLLTAFSTAAQAVHYAHARGVVHRDLKPHNIMLGDFGEVYVLDWGIAKLLGVEDAAFPAIQRDTAEATTTGEVLGTAGYMAPEQVRGDVEDIDERSDVYSLGAILFELLTLRRLNPGVNREQRAEATLAGTDVVAAARAADPELPPELVAICERATRRERRERYASVEQLLAALERFLEGDRDAELRRKMSRDHLAVAAEQLRQARDADQLSERQQAVSELGRALALDPENAEAMRMLLQLLADPPRTMPPEVEQELARDEAQTIRAVTKTAGIAFASLLCMLPLLVWMGVRSWPAVLGLCAMIATAAIATFAAGRLWPATQTGLYPAFLTSSLMIAAVLCLFGPLVVVPGMVAVNTMAFLLNFRKIRWWPLAVGACSFAVPAVLQWVGVLRPTYAFGSTSMQIVPWAVELPSTGTLAFLTVSSVVLLISGALFAISFRRTLTDARTRAHLLTWHLRQLLPDEARQQTP